VNRVVEADIRNFFGKVAREWMLKFLCHRIGGEWVIHLIVRMLRGGIFGDGLVHASEEGTPQGSISTRHGCRTPKLVKKRKSGISRV
jgi:retron-type reverse transcriptase